jgi:hypothetical protein
MSIEMWGNLVEREHKGKPSTIMTERIKIILIEYSVVICTGFSCLK